MDRYTDLEDFLARARLRLDPVEGRERLAEGGDLDFLDAAALRAIRPAGVLIGVCPRPSGPAVILTERPETMANHPGQVAFPGGKVDPTDHDEVTAALREAHEEIGLPPSDVALIGRSAPYFTGTRFRIVPVLGVLPADFQPVPEPGEVAEVFETPLAFLMDPANHQRRSAVWQGRERTYYEMPHGGHRIWGVTAGIIHTLWRILYGR